LSEQQEILIVGLGMQELRSLAWGICSATFAAFLADSADGQLGDSMRVSGLFIRQMV
jgi:hypothetical protein